MKNIFTLQRHHWLSLVLGAVCVLGVWLFLGIEVVYREHQTNYLPFAKQAPGFKIMYTNPVLCGECDVKPLKLLNQEQRAAFVEFCKVRFGLDEVRVCYAIYETTQWMVLEQWPAPGRTR